MSGTISIAEYKRLVKKNGNQSKIGETLKLMGIAYETEYRFHPVRKWMFDYAIPSLKVAIEYEGVFSVKSRHTSVTGYTKDAEKYNTAQIMGWRVLRYTAMNLKDLAGDLREIINHKTT